MARRKMTKAKPQKAVRTLTYTVPAGLSTIDIMKDLSIVNRKLFRQGYCVGIESVEFGYTGNPASFDTLRLTAGTAGDTWSVHNAHVKGHALWNQMNQLVLEDNPSIAGKWADYKVRLDVEHQSGGTLAPLDGQGNPYLAGEWIYSTYTMPQHVVNAATGEPLPADITTAHLLGDDLGVPGALTSIGLVKAYAESRATVFDNNPNVPAGMSDSFFNLLTDSGSQEPELSLEIEFQNDDPPYDLLNYPGSVANAPTPIDSEFSLASVGQPTGILSPFVAQCGLIRLNNEAFLNGAQVTAAAMTVRVTVMAGKYKGIAAIPMGQ